MPNPFPGMNPYVERATVRHDFHERWIPLVAELIGAQVLPLFRAHRRAHVRAHRGEFGAGVPNVGYAGLPAWRSGGTPLEPNRVVHFTLSTHYARAFSHLAHWVGFCPPWRSRDGRPSPLAKARQQQRGNVNFVEVDLLRGGPRMPWLDMPPCDYCVVVSRVERRPKAGIWPLRLRDPLPEIPIPLRQGDAAARLDLQQALHRIYDAAGYAYYIYKGPPEPALADDASWAAQFLPRLS